MASSNLTQALLGGMGGGGMMSPMGLGMYDPAALGAMQRLGLGQSMIQEGMSSAPAYPAQALSRLGQSLIGALMMRHGFSDLQDINKQQAAEIPALDAYIHPPAAAATTPVPAAAAAPPTAGAPTAPATVAVPAAANNPLNIRFAQQPGATNTGGFAAFPTSDAGKAATDNQFGLYADRGINTLRGLISRWAPPNENNTEGYIARVAKETGIDPDAQINLKDPGVSGLIQQSMAGVEGNKNATVPTQMAQAGGATPASPGVQTGMQNPQVQGLWETIKRATEKQAALSPYDVRGQRYLQGQLELAKTQLGLGNWQANPTNPNEMVNVNTGERKLLVTGTGRFGTDTQGNTLFASPGGGQPQVVASNPSGVTGNSPEANAMRTIAAIGPKISNGTASEQDRANYSTAAEFFQGYKTQVNPSDQSIIRIPERSLPPGMPNPQTPFQSPVPLGGQGAAPPEKQAGAGSTSPSGVTQLTPGGPPVGTVEKRNEDLSAIEKTGLGARDELQAAALLKQTMHELGSTGPATPFLANLSRYAAQAGIPDETIKKFGLPPGATETQAAALANGLVMEIARAGFPQRITNNDLQFASSVKPNPSQPLAAADFLIDNTIVPRAQRDIERYGSVVNLTNPQHADYDPSLGSLKAKLYDFDQAHPLSSYTPKLNKEANAPAAGASTDTKPTAQEFQEGQTATNPSTGKRMIFKGGSWQPL